MNDDSDLDAFLQRFRDDALIERIAKRLEMDLGLVRTRIETYLNETRIGLDVASRGLRPGIRILEVGAGLGLLSLFLCEQGFDVVALEPVGTGYDFFSVAGEEIRNFSGPGTLEWLPIGVEELDPASHGIFDFIFSVHVIEHVPDLDAAFRAMSAVLAGDGLMVHLCPNYAVPYEPHFGIPLVPGAPKATAKLFHSRIQRDRPERWPSLNFVTLRRVRHLARANRLTVEFERGMLHDFLTRIERDAIYASRHRRGALGVVYEGLRRVHLLGATRKLPPSAATPMLFTMRPERGS